MRTEWVYKRIGEICTVERGGSPRPIDDYITARPDGINWIKIGDTGDSMYITRTAQKIIPEGMKKSRYVQPGDFLLSNSMSFGRPYILKIDGCIHDGWLVLRDNEGVFDKRFLYYYLSAKPTYEKLKMMAVGGVVNNLNSEMVRKVEVPIPTPEEQSHIADLLDTVNFVILGRKQQLSALDDLIKARFVEMSLEWERMVSKAPLSDYLEFITYGFTNPMPDSDEGPWKITAKDVLGGVVNYATARKTTQEAYDQLTEKCKPQKGDVLLTKDGTLGRLAVVEKDGLCVNQSVAVLRPSCKIIPSFLMALLNAPACQREMLANSGGGTIKHLYITRVDKMLVVVPPLQDQVQFISLAKQINKSKSVIQKSLDETQLLFDSLMQKYFG